MSNINCNDLGGTRAEHCGARVFQGNYCCGAERSYSFQPIASRGFWWHHSSTRTNERPGKTQGASVDLQPSPGTVVGY